MSQKPMPNTASHYQTEYAARWAVFRFLYIAEGKVTIPSFINHNPLKRRVREMTASGEL